MTVKLINTEKMRKSVKLSPTDWMLINMTKKSSGRSARLSPELRKSEIIAAARKLLAKVGHEDFQPIDVAKLYGVSEATIYRYFPSKKDLLLAVAERWVEDLLANTDKKQEDTDLASRLYQSIEHVLQVVQKEPALTRYIFLNQRADPNYSHTRLYRLVRSFTASIIHIVEEAVERGIFRSDVPITLVRNMIFGAVEHQTWSYLRNEGGFSAEKTASYITGIIMRGMSSASPPNLELIEQSETRVRNAADNLNRELKTLFETIG